MTSVSSYLSLSSSSIAISLSVTSVTRISVSYICVCHISVSIIFISSIYLFFLLSFTIAIPLALSLFSLSPCLSCLSLIFISFWSLSLPFLYHYILCFYLCFCHCCVTLLLCRYKQTSNHTRQWTNSRPKWRYHQSPAWWPSGYQWVYLQELEWGVTTGAEITQG